jgi:hypothetical protein
MVIIITILSVVIVVVMIVVVVVVVEPGSSVSIVPGYGLVERAIGVRSQAEAKGFFL